MQAKDRNPLRMHAFESKLAQLRGQDDSITVEGPSPQDVPQSKVYEAARATRRNLRIQPMSRGGGLRSHPNLQIRSARQDYGLLVDSAQEANERISQARSFCFILEVLVALSSKQRCRAVTLSLFPPFSLLKDPQALHDPRSAQEISLEHSRHHNHPLVTMGRFLDESGRIADIEQAISEHPFGVALTQEKIGYIQQHNVSQEGLVGMIRDLCDGTFPDPAATIFRLGVPGPTTWIRVSLDGELGVTFKRQDMDKQECLSLLQAWIHDLVLNTSGHRRGYFFDPATRSYRVLTNKDRRVPGEGGLEHVMAMTQRNMAPLGG